MVLWGSAAKRTPPFNQASCSVSQLVPTKQQGLTNGQHTAHPWGGLSPAVRQTEGIGTESGNNQSAPVCCNINN